MTSSSSSASPILNWRGRGRESYSEVLKHRAMRKTTEIKDIKTITPSVFIRDASFYDVQKLVTETDRCSKCWEQKVMECSAPKQDSYITLLKACGRKNVMGEACDSVLGLWCSHCMNSLEVLVTFARLDLPPFYHAWWMGSWPSTHHQWKDTCGGGRGGGCHFL